MLCSRGPIAGGYLIAGDAPLTLRNHPYPPSPPKETTTTLIALITPITPITLLISLSFSFSLSLSASPGAGDSLTLIDV